MATSSPIWTRPEPGRRRPRFTREQLAAAALALADTEGFEAVSMRRVAAELGAGTMTLYHYVRTKDDLIALMDDAVMAEVLVPPEELPGRWRPALAEIARRTRNSLVRHPWALHALQNARLGPNALRHREQSLAALAGTSLPDAEKLAVLDLVDDYVRGNALRAQEVSQAAEPDADTVRFVREQLATGELPHLAAMLGDAARGPQSAWDFEDGLRAVLDGLAARFGLP